ncbi:hypothetical protein [Psychrobacillus psychrodurans]|uniref:hypothetical protein n=1 Tax=Psychrobacillus psychrodurans TaxID=126157 RepID=UPI003D0794B6
MSTKEAMKIYFQMRKELASEGLVVWTFVIIIYEMINDSFFGEKNHLIEYFRF